jgi:hypothetical protein
VLKLGTLLGEFGPGAKGSQTRLDPVGLLGAAWAEIVGENNAVSSRPSQVTDDALLVTTTSSARSETLALNAELILERVRARLPKAGIERLRFRVGKIAAATPTSHARRAGGRQNATTDAQPPPQNAQEALDRYRLSVASAQRAKRDRGWKECQRCNALVAPDTGPFCAPCANARSEERERLVSRLLYEAPWLGFNGTARLIEDVSADEYAGIRHRLLARWWDRLCRARRNGKLSRDGSERLLASSYVLLKSERAPERIDPATVRNVLGDELHEFIYGTEQKK